MATGVPQKKAKKIESNISLEYEGKKTVSEILKSPSSRLLEITNSNLPNKLIYGDNLSVLANISNNQDIMGKVRLIYIDPPFSTNTSFHSRKLEHAYHDVLVGNSFIEFLRERIIFLHHILANDGSLYLHLDERMIFHFKIILDEIFGASNYRACITRQKCNPKNCTTNSYGNITDYILFYTKSDKYVWNRPFDPWIEEKALKEYPCIEANTGRRYKKVPIHAPGVRQGETGQMWQGMYPPMGKHWQYTPDKLDELNSRGEIYWSPTGNPRRKIYFDKNKGVPVQNIWLDFKDAHNQNILSTGYPTEKNPQILRRIILASSNPHDLVLDCFSGSGTTLAVASELNRNWIGIDNSIQAISTTINRFKHGLRPMGGFINNKKEMTNESLPLFDTYDNYLEKESRILDKFSLFTSIDHVEYHHQLSKLMTEK